MKVPFTFLIILVFLACQQYRKPESASITKEITLYDLSHSYSDETVYWVTARQCELDTVFAGDTDKGYYYSAYEFTTAEHGGTHLDAPIHFAKGRQAVDEVPLEKLIGAAIKVDVSAKAWDDPDYLVTVDDLKSWESDQEAPIPEGSIVLLYTGHSRHYPDALKYLGTDERGDEAATLLHFPGLAPEAAQWLVDNRNINAIGLDTPSIDYGQSSLFASHVILLGENIPVFENLTNLQDLPLSGFEIIALPMKIKGGSGAPLRVVARVSQ